MKHLDVYIEISGKQVFVGTIAGTNASDAVFTYSDDYIGGGYPSVSISLPVELRTFSAFQTRNFFEGLLPEGFARKTVSNWLHAAEDDYLTILEVLGAECLGAIRIAGAESVRCGYDLLSLEDVKALAREGVSKSTELITEAHLSLTGASGKAGLYYDVDRNAWYKPIGLAPSTHIVKQSHVRLSSIVLNEQICLIAASKLGIEIPESFIVSTGGTGDSDVLFATKRYDRIMDSESEYIDGVQSPLRLHQEDFAQALGISAADKYETGSQNYLKRIFDLVRNYTSNPIEDQLKLWNILVYDFLAGNTDNHIKNLSLLYSKDLKKVKLAPAYDILSTAVYPGSSRNMAIGIGGERHIDLLTDRHFADAVSDIGLSRKVAMTQFERLANGFENAIKEACLELDELGYKDAVSMGKTILASGGYKNLF